MKRMAAALSMALCQTAWCLTGTELMDWSDEQSSPVKQEIALAYVKGYVDAEWNYSRFFLQKGVAVSPSPPSLICVPVGVQSPQAVRIVHRFLEANPQERHRDAGVLVHVALASAWPCPDDPR